MRASINKLLPKNAFARGVSILVGGTAGAQALLVLAAPLLTRIYTPEDFGLLAVFSGLLALVSVVASLCYELAIPLPESHAVAVHVLTLSLSVVMIMTGVSWLVIYLAGDRIAQVLDTPALANYFWLLPVGVLLSGVYKVFNYWALRVKAFPDIAKSRISQTLTTLVIQIFGWKLGGVALLLGQAGGQGAGSFLLARKSLRHARLKGWSWRDIWRVTVRYRQFPIFSTWSGLFNTAGTQLPPLLFAALFSAGAAGFYALAHRVLALPMSVLGNAMSKVFFSDAAQAHREGRLGPLVEKVHRKLAEIVMPVAVVLAIFGPELFAFTFGEDWRQSGEFARWMAPWTYMVFVTSPLSTLFIVLERERQGMLFQAGLLAVRVLAIYIGASLLDDLVSTVILFALASSIYYGVLLIWICLVSGNTFLVIIRPTLRALVRVIFCVLPLVLTVFWGGGSTFWLAFGGAVTGLLLLLYYAVIFRKIYMNGRAAAPGADSIEASNK